MNSGSTEAFTACVLYKSLPWTGRTSLRPKSSNTMAFILSWSEAWRRCLPHVFWETLKKSTAENLSVRVTGNSNHSLVWRRIIAQVAHDAQMPHERDAWPKYWGSSSYVLMVPVETNWVNRTQTSSLAVFPFTLNRSDTFSTLEPH